MSDRIHVQRHTRRRVKLPKRPAPRVRAIHVVTADEPFGELLSKKERERQEMFCEHGGRLYGVDELLGDGDFVFLSIGAPARGVGHGAATCFIFDAEELVRRGALVRSEDILMTREYMTFSNAALDVQKRLFNQYWNIERISENERSLSQRNRFEELGEILGSGFELEELAAEELSAEQLRFFMRESRALRETHASLKYKHDQITFKGDKALSILRQCTAKGGECEVLVPKRLSLFLARKTVQREELPFP